MNCSESGAGMLVTQGHEWAYTTGLKEYDKRIDELPDDNKEILLLLLKKTWYPRLYETITMNPVDYGDHVVVQVIGFTKEWDDIPTGFEITMKVYDYVKKALEVLELEIDWGDE